MINIEKILQHNVLGKLLNHLVVFFINILLVHVLGATGSGAYFNELYVLNFVVFVFSAGLDYAAITLLSQEPLLLTSIRKMMFKTLLFFAALMSLYVFFILPQYSPYFNQPATAIIFFSVGNLMLIFYQGILSAQKKFNQQNLVLVSTNSAFLIYLLTIYYSDRLGSISTGNIQLLYAILFFIQGIVMFILGRGSDAQVKVSVSWTVFIRSGIYIMFSSLVYFAFLRIDNFFVQKYSNAVTLSNYVQCGKIGQYFLYFSSVISSTLLPFIASETIGSSYKEWKKMMRPYIILLCSGAIAIAIAGKQLFPLLFGKDFSEMYNYMIILLPGFVCLGILTLINAIYIGKGNIRKILTGDIMALIVVMAFDSWLVPSYGALAAAFISSVAYCLLLLYLFSGFKKQFSSATKKSDIIPVI